MRPLISSSITRSTQLLSTSTITERGDKTDKYLDTHAHAHTHTHTHTHGFELWDPGEVFQNFPRSNMLFRQNTLIFSFTRCLWCLSLSLFSLSLTFSLALSRLLNAWFMDSQGCALCQTSSSKCPIVWILSEVCKNVRHIPSSVSDLSGGTEASDNLWMLDEERCRLDTTHTFWVLRFPGANLLCNDGKRCNISINYSDIDAIVTHVNADGMSPDKALDNSRGWSCSSLGTLLHLTEGFLSLSSPC